MLSKQYEFTTGNPESSKFLDFSDYFLTTNKPFLIQLYIDKGATYETVLLGDGEGVNIDSSLADIQTVTVVVNESENTFLLNWLKSNTTYKIVILQLN